MIAPMTGSVHQGSAEILLRGKIRGRSGAHPMRAGTSDAEAIGHDNND